MMKKKKNENEKLIKKMNAIPPMQIKGNDNNNGLDKKSMDLNSPMIGGSVPNFARGSLLYVDPMFDPLLFLFPKDRLDEINKRLRHYYETDEIVGGAIDIHTIFPLTDFYLECENKENERFWNDWKDRVGLLEYLRALIHDYWLLGEGIGVPVWDHYNSEISHFVQYPPEYIDIIQVYASPKKFFMLKPDPTLIDKINSNDPADKAIISTLSEDYIDSLKNKTPYFLGDDSSVMYLARTSTKYRSRGVSLLTKCLKNLLYKDKLRLLQLAYVDRHYHPLKIFKLGSESKGWIPSKQHFEKLQQMLANSVNDPDASILWHFGLQVEYVGTKDKIQNLVPEFEWVEKQIMAALFVNTEIIHGGIPSAVRDTVSIRTLMMRYNDLRDKIERMLVNMVFLPMARARGMFKKARTGESKLDKKSSLDASYFDIPKPIWKKINLVNNTAEQQLFIALEEQGKIPLSMVFDILGIDSRLVQAKMKEQESTIMDPVYRQIRDEMAKEKGIREQILGGVKHDKWINPSQKKTDNTSAQNINGGIGGLGLGQNDNSASSALSGVSTPLSEPPKLEPINPPAAELSSELPPMGESISGESLPKENFDTGEGI